jgi:nucleotide-binding universal stress UspA family protein
MRVLLATDGSTHAEEAAWLLAHLPHPEKLDLAILSVYQPSDMHRSLETVEWIKRDLQARRVGAQGACDRIKNMFEGANVQLSSVIAEGHAGKTIVETAGESKADLVIVGAKGHTVLDRLTLGSVSDFVATNAHCSVLVVRPTGLREPGHRELKICLAYDDSEPSRLAVQQLGTFEWRKNTTIDVVSAYSTAYTYMGEPIIFDPATVEDATREVNERAIEQLKSNFETVHSQLVESSHAGDGIVQFAGEHSTDIIVLGDTGRNLLGRFLLGSVARYVLRHATCSVWIVRERK